MRTHRFSKGRMRRLSRPAMAFMAAGLLVAAATSRVGAVTTGPTATTTTTTPTTTPPPLVALHGEGSDDPLGEMTTWQNDLFGTGQNGLIDLHYLANGGFAGRQDLLSGSIDYVMSGVPFTASELATLPHGAADLIDAPVQVAAMGMMLQPPATSFGSFGVLRQVCDGDPTQPGTNCPPPPLPPGVQSDGTLWVPYTGPVKVPSPNLGAMLFNYPGGGFPPLHEWDSAGVTSALEPAINLTQGTDLGPPTFIPQGVLGGSPTPYLRSEPSETDYYLQQFVTTAAPAVWTGLQTFNHITFGPVTERLPVLAVGTRPGVDAQVQAAEVPEGLSGGYLAPVPPYAIARARTDAPKQTFEWIQVQNANGDWLEPTPATINAAVNAGGDTPLYALNNKVPGAYPLVWVTHLYAPAHGLSAAKTETLATVIRYLATAGQAATTAAGDGQLPSALMTKALAAANQLVLSNCTGAGVTVTASTSPGPYAPASLAAQHLDQMLHCTQTPAPAPTTTASSTTTTTTLSSALTSGSGTGSATQAPATTPTASPLATPAAAVTAAPAAGTGAPATTKKGTGVPILASLPMPVPWSGHGWDPLSGMVMGAGLFLVGRKPWRALVQALKT